MAPDATGLALRQVLLRDCPLPSEPRPRGKGRRWGRPVLASSQPKILTNRKGGGKGGKGGQTPKDEKNKKHKIKRVKNKHGANCHSLHASTHTLSPSNSHSNSFYSPFSPSFLRSVSPSVHHRNHCALSAPPGARAHAASLVPLRR